MYRQPFASAFTRALGQLLGEALNSLTTAVPKVLAVDADNTLWGGIVGEDGADGVDRRRQLPGQRLPGAPERPGLPGGQRHPARDGQQEQRHRRGRAVRGTPGRPRPDRQALRREAGRLEQQGRQPGEHRRGAEPRDRQLRLHRRQRRRARRGPAAAARRTRHQGHRRARRDRRAHRDADGVPVREGLQRGPAAHLDDAGRGRPQGRGRRGAVARGLPRLARPDRARVPARSPPTSAG